jgi:hypothetical protein
VAPECSVFCFKLLLLLLDSFSFSSYSSSSSYYYYIYIILHYSFEFIMNVEFLRLIFDKFSNIKFYENPSDGRRTDSQTDMTKLIISFRSFVNASRK